MNRRKFIQVASVSPIAATALKDKPRDDYQPYGYMDVDRHWLLKRRDTNLRIFLDGRDVTDDCRWADDVRGEAQLLLRNAEGNHYAVWKDGDCFVAEQTLRGKVRFYASRTS